MDTWLYALLPASSSAPAATLVGVAGAPVRVLRAGVADAWVSDAPRGAAPRDVRAARAHDAVVHAALETGVTPVPARFAQRFASDDACVSSLAREASRLAALLARVRGMVEMSVIARLESPAAGGPPPIPSFSPAGERASPSHRTTAPSGAAPGTGRAYLEQRKAELALERNLQRSAATLRARVAAALQTLPCEEAVRYAPPPAATLTLSHLIARDAVAQYRTALAVLQSAPESPTLAIVGPMAPYRFAELPDAGV
jgi:hypothetical protein